MSSFALKLLAVVTMLIDHIAAVFGASLPLWAFIAMRSAGRLAMPIFCFLIAEGLLHTSNARRYMLRLLGFALLSELPFDLMLSGELLYWPQQNVLFTLLFALMGILLYDSFAASNRRIPALVSIIAAGAAAQLLGTDYGLFGVYFVFVFYLFRGQRLNVAVFFGLGAVMLTLAGWMASYRQPVALVQLFSLFALGPLFAYTGKPGRRSAAMKYGFYAFYPTHMLLLWILHGALS